MTEELSDRAILEQLAVCRWGPTGFCCPRCGHTAAWVLQTRPRVRQCRRCQRQVSVTAGTLMHRTRLPLSCWVRRGQQLETQVRIPSTTELALQLGIARSSAWLLNQKILCCVETPPLDASLPAYLTELVVRRPKPGIPMDIAAPAFVRELHARQMAGERRAHDVTVSIYLLPRGAELHRVGLSPEEAYLCRLRPRGPVIYEHLGLARWLRCGRRVSLRWLPRWMHGEMAAWSLGKGQPPPSWRQRALASGPRPLRGLDPWAAAPA